MGASLVGSWKVSSSCVSANATAFGITECPMIPADLSKVVVNGSVAFGMDGNEQVTETFSGIMSMTFPSSCLAADGGIADCDLLTSRLSSKIASQGGTGPFSSAACQSAGGGCLCTYTFNPIVMNQTSTYSTSGAVLTERSGQGEVTESTYCVSGTTLTLHTDGMMKGADGITGTITFTKQ